MKEMTIRLITSEWWISVPDHQMQRILDETIKENVKENETIISAQMVEDNGKRCFYIFTVMNPMV